MSLPSPVPWWRIPCCAAALSGLMWAYSISNLRLSVCAAAEEVDVTLHGLSFRVWALAVNRLCPLSVLEVADPKRTTAGTIRPQRYVQNDRGTILRHSGKHHVTILFIIFVGATYKTIHPFWPNM